MAMRLNYWNEAHSEKVAHEKNFLQRILAENHIFQPATLDDAKYLFFSLPSIIIVKGYAVGFSDESVKIMIEQFILKNKSSLISRSGLKIEYTF